MTEDVWYIHPNTLTPDQSGPTRSYDIANQLVKKGLSIRVISSSFHYEKYTELKKYDEGASYLNEEINGVQFTWIKTFPYRKNNIRRLVNWIDLFLKIKNLNAINENSPKIIIGSSPNPIAAYAAFKLSEKVGAKFIFEFRDIWPDTLTEAFGLNKYHPLVILVDWIVKKLYQESEAVVSTLPGGYKKVMEGSSKNRSDVTWIPNGVNTEFFNQENLKLPDELLHLNNNNKFNVVYAGSIGNVYGLLSLVDAAKIFSEKNIDNIHFTLIGDGALKSEMLAKAENFKLSNINFINPINKKYIPSVLSSADILYASMKEKQVFKYGISMNKIQEYLLMKKPVVLACESCAENPVLLSKSGVIANSEDPISIFNAINYIYNLNNDEREEMGKRGKNHVLDNFTMEGIGDKYFNLIKNQINKIDK